MPSVSLAQADDGLYYVVGFGPAILASPDLANVTTTTADGLINIDKSSGTLYGLVNQTASSPTGPAVVSGGVEVTVSSSGLKTVPLTGLTAGQSYYVHFCHVTPSGWLSPVITSAQFTTDSGTPSPGGSNASRINNILNLYTVPSRFDIVEYPTDPTTTNSVSVSSQAELNSALVSGNEITVNAGSYTDLFFSGTLSDIDVIINSGVEFSGRLVFDPGAGSSTISRIRVTGGTFNGGVYTGRIQTSRVSNILMDNVRLANSLHVSNFDGRPNRVAVINTSIDGPGNGYGILGSATNFIVANCDIENLDSTVAGVRIVTYTNTIFAGTRIYTQGNRIFRAHADHGESDLLLLTGMQLESNGDNNLWWGPGAGTGGDAINRTELHNNQVYFPNPNGVGAVAQTDTDVGLGIDDFILAGNQFYTPHTSFTGNPPTNYSETGSTYSAYQTPPAFSGGADH